MHPPRALRLLVLAVLAAPAGMFIGFASLELVSHLVRDLGLWAVLLMIGVMLLLVLPTLVLIAADFDKPRLPRGETEHLLQKKHEGLLPPEWRPGEVDIDVLHQTMPPALPAIASSVPESAKAQGYLDHLLRKKRGEPATNTDEPPEPSRVFDGWG